jgi:hypothetical protein
MVWCDRCERRPAVRESEYDGRCMNWAGDEDGVIDPRERRVIRNETLFREVNERIEDVSEDVPRSEFIGFLCECGETACVEQIELTREEYEQIRSVPDHFAIKPGHEHPDFERVLNKEEGYAVIDKVGQAEDVAERTDPRG